MGKSKNAKWISYEEVLDFLKWQFGEEFADQQIQLFHIKEKVGGNEMNQFIKTCDSIYGGTSCIYRFVNPNQIVEVHITHTEREVNVEALLTSGQRVLILEIEDLEKLVGEKYTEEIREAIKELTHE